MLRVALGSGLQRIRNLPFNLSEMSEQHTGHNTLIVTRQCLYLLDKLLTFVPRGVSPLLSHLIRFVPSQLERAQGRGICRLDFDWIPPLCCLPPRLTILHSPPPSRFDPLV